MITEQEKTELLDKIQKRRSELFLMWVKSIFLFKKLSDSKRRREKQIAKKVAMRTQRIWLKYELMKDLETRVMMEQSDD